MTSRVAELAAEEAERAEREADEAARAEGENPEPGEPEPGEPEPGEPEPGEPEAKGGASRRGRKREPEVVDVEKAIEKAARANERELARIFADGWAEFEPCRACGSLGFRHVEAIPLDEATERCETCKGHGVLLTGAVREDRIARECTACGGEGFRYKTPEPPPLEPAGPPVARFDPYTGRPLEEAGGQENGGAQAGWAPGYQPPARSLPGAAS